jgi:Ca2+-binding EF-hand superfamily protein
VRPPAGSAYYIAPEVFRGPYTKEADIFSLGVNLFLMLSGTVPFGARAKSEEAIYAALQTETLHFEGVWERSTPAVRELLTGLLDKDPAKRYTLAQVLAHPWVSGDAATDERIDRSILSSLLSFTAKNKFKKEALRLAATAMTAQDVAKLRTAFMRIDADNSGFITFAELSQEVGKLEVADAARISTAMREMDADGDGKVSYDEFITAVVDRQLMHHQNMCVALADRGARSHARAQGRERGRACAASAGGLQPSSLCGPLTASFSPLPCLSPLPARPRRIWFAFCEYDLDGDGKITRDELSRALTMHGEPPEKVAAYISEFDSNGDGHIDYEEFMRMLLPKDVNVRCARRVRRAPPSARARARERLRSRARLERPAVRP